MPEISLSNRYFRWWCLFNTYLGFPGSSAGKESTCRSPGEGIGCPLQYSWASLVTQMVKNLTALWATWVQLLSWEDPLEEVFILQYSHLENPHRERSLVGCNPWGCNESDMTERLSTAQACFPHEAPNSVLALSTGRSGFQHYVWEPS